jgi:uncharacterized BrkB/YihY/UPF0761 family membrane protein
MDVGFGIVFDQLAEIAAGFLKLLPGLVVGLIVFILFYCAASGVRLLVRRLLHASGRPEDLGRVLGHLSRWLFITLGFLIALLIAFPDFSVGQLVQILVASSNAIPTLQPNSTGIQTHPVGGISRFLLHCE